MRRLAAFAVVFVLVLSPITVAAQEPASAQLQQLVNEQLRRIEALEAQLAQLQQQVEVIRGQQPPTVITEEDRLEEPVEHAYDGGPPMDPAAEEPNADLPRAINVDSYGSLRVLAATDTDGRGEIRNNSSRLGIRGEKELFGALTAFARYEMGMNMVANDRAILLISGDPGTPIGQGSQAITTRLGFVGIGTPIGNFSWGKRGRRGVAHLGRTSGPALPTVPRHSVTVLRT